LRQLNGGRSVCDLNADKRWLSESEEKAVVDYTIELANHGFPLSHGRLREHVNEIAWTRYGKNERETDSGKTFPETGIGENWTARFIQRHPQLQAYWSRSLDHSRARAVNPNTKEAFYNLYAETVEGEGEDNVIPPELIWGADETGFQSGIGGRERVFGLQWCVSVQMVQLFHQPSSTKESVFRRAGSKTTQANSLGHSQKGYVNGEIGIEWIKHFDKVTKAKANGRRRGRTGSMFSVILRIQHTYIRALMLLSLAS